MDIVRKNLLSIICGAVALLAVVAAFWPTQSYYAELDARLKDRKAEAEKLARLLSEKRYEPRVIHHREDPPALQQFPSEKVIQWGKRLKDDVRKQSLDLKAKAVQINQAGREVLVTLRPDQFRDKYDSMLRLTATPPARRGELLERIRAVVPPTQKDVEAERDRLKAQINAKVTYGRDGQPINREALDAELREAEAKAADTLRSQRAMEGLVWLTGESSFAYNQKLREAMSLNKPPLPWDMWFAQVGLWIQQDVVQAIVDSNAGCQNVMDSVVKRVHEIKIPASYYREDGQFASTAAPVGGGTGPGAGPRSGERITTASDPNMRFRYSPTGRAGAMPKSMYDVVHFDMVVDCDAARFPRFLRELSRNRLIAVMQASVKSVDRAAAGAAGFVYGNAPVVQLELKCEAIFFRDWTEPLMPADVKMMLGIGEQAF